MELSERHRRIWIFLSILGAVIIVIIFPFNLVIAPERKLQILDNNGNPIANALVSQFWDQYSLGEHGEIRLTTNSEGRIILPKREVRTTILSLLRGGLKEFRDLGIHASYGSGEDIFISLNNHLGKSFHDGKGLESGKVIIDIADKKDESK